MKKRYTKEFYMFLCQEGVVFQFLDLLKTTKFKTIKQHCEKCNPKNYVRYGHTFSDSKTNKILWGDWDIIWKPINERWIQHLIINLYKMKK